MESNTLQPESSRTDLETTRAQYQSPTITNLGGLEQKTLSVFTLGTGDTWGDNDPLSDILASS